MAFFFLSSFQSSFFDFSLAEETVSSTGSWMVKVVVNESVGLWRTGEEVGRMSQRATAAAQGSASDLTCGRFLQSCVYLALCVAR